MSVGTPAYMSPEQASGASAARRPHRHLQPSAACCTRCWPASRRSPGPRAQAIIAKRFHTDAVPLRLVRPTVPQHVEHAVTRALARVPGDRFASAAELARAFDGDATTALPVGAPARRRHAGRPAVLLLAFGVLLGLGVLFVWSRTHRAALAGDPGLQRVAVLPFDNLAAADKVYFAEGITDEIRGKLATMAGLQVTARTSSAQYAGSTKRPEQIGRELGVTYLLSGTVRWDQEGGQSRVRVSPELINAATGATRWQQSFDAPMTDVFRMQADVAERVARELGVALADADRRHLEARPTGDLGAYDLYLRGRYAWHQRTAAGLDHARRLLARFAFALAGGVVAVACLRGGGEYDSAWHDAGRLADKQQRLRRHDRLRRAPGRRGLDAIPRTSPCPDAPTAGCSPAPCSPSVPDLFAAVVPEVGVLDMLRFPLWTIGWAWTSDYGDPRADEAQFRTLLAYSPLHNLRPGRGYPPVMVMTSDHDDRVAPAHSMKFAASAGGLARRRRRAVAGRCRGGRGPGPLARRPGRRARRRAALPLVYTGLKWRYRPGHE